MMKYKSLYIIACILLIFFNIGCTSLAVEFQGIAYFEGKEIDKLYDYFDGKGLIKSVKDTNERYYDSVLYCTNEILTYNLSKTNTIVYKVANRKPYYSFWFYKFPDGCLHRKPHKYRIGDIEYHENLNSTIQAELNYFYKIVNNYESYDISEENIAIKNHQIGSSYYLYSIKEEYTWLAPPLGSTDTFYYVLWQVDIVADKQYETEQHNFYYYYSKDKYFDENMKIISENDVKNFISYYQNNDFILHTKNSGVSFIAYIKDGIIKSVSAL